MRPIAAHGSVFQKESQVCRLVRSKVDSIEPIILANNKAMITKRAIEGHRIVFTVRTSAMLVVSPGDLARTDLTG
jgi:hypothetical protein